MKNGDFRFVIGLWPTQKELASDIRKNYATVRQWNKRNSIPSEYWCDIVEAAKRRKINSVSHESLARLARKFAA